MDSSVSPKDEIWFLRVCHHISTSLCLCVMSGFGCELDKICALLGNYEAYSGNSFLMFRDNLSVPSDVSRNVGIIRCVISQEIADIIVFLVRTLLARGGVKVNFHSFLTSAVTRSVWSVLQTMKRQLVKQGNYSTRAEANLGLGRLGSCLGR